MPLPESCKTLLLAQEGSTLTVTLNRPDARNAMTLELVEELEAVFEAVEGDRGVRTVVLRGAGGHFCAGGDIKEMAAARAAQPEGGRDPLALTNRRFGALITKVDRAPQAVVAVLEGAVLGGGFGLACVADVALALADTKFGLPETGLGVPPAQIASFLVGRLGSSQARRLAVTGGRFDGREALALGLVHFVFEDAAALQAQLEQILDQIDRCAPTAIAVTKGLMLEVGVEDHDALLDRASELFAAAVRGPEGIEGMTAFIGKRPPSWSTRQKSRS
jgi:isohexenylglutaconyl-CoA hydratase